MCVTKIVNFRKHFQRNGYNTCYLYCLNRTEKSLYLQCPFLYVNNKFKKRRLKLVKRNAVSTHGRWTLIVINQCSIIKLKSPHCYNEHKLSLWCESGNNLYTRLMGGAIICVVQNYVKKIRLWIDCSSLKKFFIA
uniref:Uncharacterized protein n=1 Tax=Cacopsylla melanoneura TaxID=428564 RepID=A0A8D9ATB2_9HEMI